MVEKEMNLMGKILIMFIVVIFAVTFLNVLGNQISPLTTTDTSNNETINIANAVSSKGDSITDTYDFNVTNYNEFDSAIAIKNSSAFDTLTYTVTTDYVVNSINSSHKSIRFKNSTNILNLKNNASGTTRSGAGNKTYITYSYFPADYITDSTSRTLTTLIILLFSIGGLISVTYYFMPTIKEYVGM